MQLKGEVLANTHNVAIKKNINNIINIDRLIPKI